MRAGRLGSRSSILPLLFAADAFGHCLARAADPAQTCRARRADSAARRSGDLLSAAPTTIRYLIASVVVGTAILSAPAVADDPGTVRRIGVLTASLPNSPVEAGLREGLRDLGYIEGKNIIIEWRRSLGTDEELRSLATELATSKVELIVAFSTPPAKAALQATTLPVVFASGDPVASGLAVSLAKPGGHGTGVSSVTTDLTPKRVAHALKLKVPQDLLLRADKVIR